MPVKLFHPQYLVAAVDKAQQMVQGYQYHPFYNPAMTNQVGYSQYLLTPQNLSHTQGQKLNFLA